MNTKSQRRSTSRLIFDLETDGLLPDVTKIHLLVTKDIDTNEVTVYKNETLDQGIRALQSVDLLIGHNVINYDLPVIAKLHKQFIHTKIHDTLVLSRLLLSNIADLDYALRRVPGKLIGSHSLKAWGIRLGNHKGDYSEKTDWKEWTPEMEQYCIQDVEVNHTLYNHLMAHVISDKAVDIEMRFARLMTEQERAGFKFDIDKAVELKEYLDNELDITQSKINEIIPPYDKSLKRKVITVIFNPRSGEEIADHLTKKYGWTPTVFTDTGRPKCDEDTLSCLPYPEIPLILQYQQLAKIKGMLEDGNNSWFKFVGTDGRIHGYVNSCGAVTGRCTHRNPNLAQTPSAKTDLGNRCRALFTVEDGWKLVGTDASGLELRCLAHYLYQYDQGEFRDVLLHGDIHTENQKAFNANTRTDAKTAIYALIYGCSPRKLAVILGRREDEGRELLESYFKRWPQVRDLIHDVQRKAKSFGYLIGIDGRKLHVRSQHAALNTLLQSAGAIVMKVALLRFVYLMNESNKNLGHHYKLVANIHDEFQVECWKYMASNVAELSVQSIRDAGRALRFNCPLEGEAKIGDNWAETH